MFQLSKKTQTGRILAKGLVVSVFALASILLVESAFGQFPGFGEGGGRGRGPGGKRMKGRQEGKMVEFLGMTEVQQADAKKIRQAARDQSQPIRKQLRANRKALGEAIQAGKTAQIDTLADQRGQLQGQLIAIGAKRRMELFRNVLTPEQQQKWASFQERRKTRREERRQRMRERSGRGPGGD